MDTFDPIKALGDNEEIVRYATRRSALLKRLAVPYRERLCHGSALFKAVDVASYLNWISGQMNQDPRKLGTTILLLYYLSAPEKIMSLGYDQVRYAVDDIPKDDVPEDLLGLSGEIRQAIEQDLEKPRLDGGYVCEQCKDIALALCDTGVVQYRTTDGVWHGFEHFYDTLSSSISWPTAAEAALEQMMSRLESPQAERSESLISLPDLRLPDQPFEETGAHYAAQRIIKELADTDMELRDIHWRELEELVAETLHSLGFEITLTPRSKDGGRDVVARGEFIPGEPLLLAVEVKQMEVVPVSELRDALWANRHFPALLVATAGRFSAGVLREARQHDTRLRLLLKDGVALKQWLDHYSKQRARTTWQEIESEG